MRLSLWVVIATAWASIGCSKTKPHLEGVPASPASTPTVTTPAVASAAPYAAPASARAAKPGRLPAGFDQLRRANLVEIADEWNGLGRTHDVFIRLERKAGRFAYRAKLSAMAGAIGERVVDPTTPVTDPACVCAVDAACDCEWDKKPLRRSGTAPASAVEAFLAVVAKHAIDRSQSDERGPRWTDDYPKGHVAVWIPGRSSPIHLSFLDQRRRWRVDGKFLDDPSPDPAQRIHHTDINAAYREMLRRIGLESWMKSLGGRGKL